MNSKTLGWASEITSNNNERNEVRSSRSETMLINLRI